MLSGFWLQLHNTLSLSQIQSACRVVIIIIIKAWPVVLEHWQFRIIKSWPCVQQKASRPAGHDGGVKWWTQLSSYSLFVQRLARVGGTQLSEEEEEEEEEDWRDDSRGTRRNANWPAPGHANKRRERKWEKFKVTLVACSTMLTSVTKF